MTDIDKLRRISRIADSWREPESQLTSYQAMMAIITTLQEAAGAGAPRQEAQEAEITRWRRDQPDHPPPVARIKQALRAKSWLG